MKRRLKKWPKRIRTWVQIWHSAINWRPSHKISYGARPAPRYYVAQGGPYDGKLLALVDGDTAVIRVKRGKHGSEWRGRYLCGMCATRGSHSSNHGTTVWSPK